MPEEREGAPLFSVEDELEVFDSGGGDGAGGRRADLVGAGDAGYVFVDGDGGVGGAFPEGLGGRLCRVSCLVRRR